MNNLIKLFPVVVLALIVSCIRKEPEPEPNVVRVESVILNQTSKAMTIGETLQLEANINPSSATNQSITWTSSKPAVASVSSSGLVSALSEGETTVTASADGKKAECVISVSKAFIEVSEVMLDKAELILYEGDEDTLTAIVLPDDATDKTITWRSSDESIATVESGKVKALRKGEATIIAQAGEKTAGIKITVLAPVSGITLDKDNLELYIGESEALTATITPDDAVQKEPVLWKSSDETIATVSDGVITAVGKGEAVITAKVDGRSASCSVVVLKPVSGISLNKTSLELIIDESETLIASIVPSDATPREEIVWSSSNTKVATVESGVVKAIVAGNATITASLEGYAAECSVTVSKPAYAGPALKEVNVTDKFKTYGVNGYTDEAWFNNYSPKSQRFIYPHILVSYVASEWYWHENMEYIIMGEVPEEIPCENVGDDHPSNIQFHADAGYVRIKDLAPRAVIKACGGVWSYLRTYVANHPERMFMVSCATDYLGGDTSEELRKEPQYQELKQILDNENVIVCVGVGNIKRLVITLEENAENPFFNKGGGYGSASVTSSKNNKYAVAGYNANFNNIFWDDNESKYPIGFGKGNTVVPFIAGPTPDGIEETTTHNSYSTSFFRTTLGNFLSILLKAHPGITLEGASTIMQEQYFRAEKMKYLDDSSVVKEGGDWYFFKTEEFIDNEILQKDAVDVAFSSSAQVVNLPSSGGLCYIGPGIQFDVDGKSYEMTEQNRNTLVSAISAGKEIKWSFNRTIANEYATDTASVTVRILDHSGNLLPDIRRTISLAH